MKRYLILLGLFILSVVSAAPTLKFQNEDITVGETIIGDITIADGEFTKSIESENLKFYEGRKEVFFEEDIFYFNGSYYFYVYTTRTGDFNLKIENVLCEEKGILISANLEKNFEVKEIENSSGILSIKPGVVYLKSEPKIEIYNVGNAPINFTYGKNEVELGEDESKEVYYTPVKEFSYIEIESYKDFSIPVIGKKNTTVTNGSNEEIYLKVSPTLILGNTYVGDQNNFTIEMFNFGDENITDIDFSSSLDFVKFESLKKLDARQSQNVSVLVSPERENRFTDTVNITYKQNGKSFKTEFYIDLYVFAKGSNTTNISEETCEDKHGKVCELEEICENSSEWTKGGIYCCLGNCKTIDNTNEENYNWIYGILIIVVILIFGFMIYSKYKKTAPKNPVDNLREISKKYEGK